MQATGDFAGAVWGGAFVVLLGLLLAAWGAGMLLGRRRTEREGEHATATVVENEVTEDMEHTRLFHPIVEFRTAAGRAMRVRLAWSTQLRYPVGTAVSLCYPPLAPEAATVVGQGRLGPVLVIVLGAFGAFLGLAFVAVGLLGPALGFTTGP